MTTALAAESEARQLPLAQVAPPISLDQILETASSDKVTPLHEALGLTGDETPSGLVQARQLTVRHPDSVIALARLAQAEMSAGNIDEARAAALQALERDQENPYFAAARSAAVSVLSRVGQELDEETWNAIEDPVARIGWASDAARSGQFDVALKRLGALASPAAYALRGYCYVKSDKHANAVASYRAARKSGVESVEVLINLGYALASLGAFRKAITATSLATHVAPKNKVASFNLIRYLSHEREHGLMLTEFDRIAHERPWDPQVALARAWVYAGSASGNKRAVKILQDAKILAARSGSSFLPDISASLAYLKHSTGQLSPARMLDELWAALRDSGYKSEEIIRMLLGSLNHRRQIADAERLADETKNIVPGPLWLLVQSKIAYLKGDPSVATELAGRAAGDDPENEHGTAVIAAYLVGEVHGEYERAAQITGPAYEENPGVDLVNNLAFNLALSGAHEKALALLREYPFEDLPFHGATLGLSLLCAGETDHGLQIYSEAERKLRDSGDTVTADCVATRAGLALRELGVDHPRASVEELAKVWPRDIGDPRVSVLLCVAERTGLSNFS
ncbi:hypothetical protein [Oerskovia sp. Root22]|uniref:tetratricopeptide repeat protein n=1 Tax=Oerskovia sp. Root22 TaxID=1736494 RepID=UPI000B2BF811|nr:hypothetical protein [Oerskovia sp. Root22]